MIPTRPAGGEPVPVQAVPPALTAPNADPPRLAAAAVPSAAALRAAARDSIAPRAHRVVGLRPPVVILIVARAAIVQPGVLAALAPQTEQVPTKVAVPARAVPAHAAAIEIAPPADAVLQHQQRTPAVPS